MTIYQGVAIVCVLLVALCACVFFMRHTPSAAPPRDISHPWVPNEAEIPADDIPPWESAPLTMLQPVTRRPGAESAKERIARRKARG